MKKRGLSLWMALCLMLSLASPALAAESASAIRLTKTTGTVTVSKSSEKPLTLLKNMRLYNGYHVKTDSGSYAWLDLDDTKLAKMDTSSEVEVRRSGKKLEVNVSSGGVFFDVAEKLKDDESLNISTSTMIVGIRGTAGYVTVEDRWTTHVTILEGSARCSVTDPVTGQVETATIHGGETATCVVYRPEQTADRCDILLERQEVPSIPGFVLAEVVRNMDLCGRIEAATGVDIPAEVAKTAGGDPSGRVPDRTGATREVLREADQRESSQAAERQEAQEAAEKLQAAENGGASPDKALDPRAPQSGAGGSGGSGSSGGSSGGGSTPPPAASVTRTMKLTDMEVQALLGSYSTVTLQPDSAPDATVAYPNTLEVDTGLSVASGKTLTLEAGVDLLVHPGKTLRVDGTVTADALTNNGATTVNGGSTLRLRGGLLGGGTLVVPAGGRVVVDGTFSPSGALTLTNGTAVLAKTFGPNISLPQDWAVSQTADGSGYYQLVYTGGVVDPGSTVQVTLNDNFSSVRSGLTDTTTQAEIDTTGPSAALPAGPTAPAANSGALASYTFAGWYDAATGGTQITDAGTLETGATLYAHWSMTGWDWDYDSASTTLRILGEGAIPDYTVRDGVNCGPWSGYSSTATKLVIGEGITALGGGAFSAFTRLQSVENNSTALTDIGDSAFLDCAALTDFSAGGNPLRSIGASAFMRCYKLAGLDLPDSVETMGDRAFFACEALGGVNLPASLQSVPTYGFYGCSGLAEAAIPEGVTAIGDHAFGNCSGLTDIAVPDTVTEIGSMAFFGCTGMQTVAIPGGVTAISADVFQGCTGLTDIYFGGTRARWDTFAYKAPGTVTVHCAYTVNFDNNAAAYQPNNTNSIVTLNTNADGTLVLPDNVTAPSPNTGANAVYTLEGWYLRDAAAGGETKLEAGDPITQDNLVLYAHWNISSGWDWIYDSAKTTLRVFGESMTNFGSTGSPWYTDRADITTLALEEGLAYVGNYAFRNCTGLTSVTIPDSVTSMGFAAFDGCGNLEQVSFGSGLAEIPDLTFRSCGKLDNVAIPNTAGKIGQTAFQSCASLANITIPNSVTEIGTSAFSNCTNLTSITLPSALTKIDGHLFDGCSGLKTIEIPEAVEEIGTAAFQSCNNLGSVTIHDKVTKIGGFAFSGCSGLTSITIPGSVATIGGNAFDGCTGLSIITFDGTTTQWQAIMDASPDFKIPDTIKTVKCTDGPFVTTP